MSPRIFVSYAHKGEGALVVERLKKLLDTLGLPAIIWSDHDIGAGDEWKEKIDAALRNASVAVLLIDEDFLRSDFIRTHELPALLAHRTSNDRAPEYGDAMPCSVVPVLVQDCLYAESMPQLSAKQFEPENTLRSRVDRERKRFPELLTLEDLAGDEFKAETSRFYKQFAKGLNQAVQDADARAKILAEGQDESVNEHTDEKRNQHLSGDTDVDESGSRAMAARYLRRGEDIVRDSVDIQISLLPSEWSTYRVAVRYSFTDGTEDRTTFWSGLAFIDVHGTQASTEHPGHALLAAGVRNDKSKQTSLTVSEVIEQARTQADELGIPLQFRFAISAGSGELQEIVWESLPLADGVPIGEHDNLLFSRAVLSIGDDAVEFQARARTGFRALCAVSTKGAATAAAKNADLQPLLGAMRETLTDVLATHDAVESLNDPDLGTLESSIRDGATCDVLYLVCEGGRDGNEYFLSFAEGDLTRARAVELFRHTPVPRIVIITPLHVLTNTEAPVGSLQAIWHVAVQFSRLGVAAVLTCNCALPSPAWHNFVRAFCTALKSHGHVPGAVLRAREVLAGTSDASSPILFSRVKAARLWFTPGFISDDRSPATRWKQLLASLRDHRLCPVIGPRVHHRLQQQRVVLARELADKHDFPLGFSHRIDLPSVTQYVRALYASNPLFIDEFTQAVRARLYAASGGTVACDSGSLKQDAYQVAQYLLAQEPDSPFNGLARLPIELYLTTALGPFMEAALDLVKETQPSEGTRSLEDFSVLDFSKVDIGRPDAAPDEILPSNRFSISNPLVVHFYGSYDDLSKAVITEDDYFELLVNFNDRMADVRSALRGKLSEVDLVFLGFKWNSLDFRVIFRALQRYADKYNEDAFHLAVQIDPDDDDTLHPEKVREYLRRHLSGASHAPQARLSLFLGSPEDFIRELERRWRESTQG